MNIKAHFNQELQLIMLYCLQCLPVIFIFELWFVDIIKKNMLWPLQNFKVFYIINIHSIYYDSSVVLNTFHP